LKIQVFSLLVESFSARIVGKIRIYQLIIGLKTYRLYTIKSVSNASLLYGKSGLIFVSNRLDWPYHLDPRVKSFLKLNELIFKPYNAIDLQHILRIRVEKAINPKMIEPGVIEKIAAMASREHGDARKAIEQAGKVR